MELTKEQRVAVAGWAREGAGLSEIQKRLNSEFGIRMTYMDVRFLVLDLGVEIQERKVQSTGGALAIGKPGDEPPGTAPAGDDENDVEEDMPMPDAEGVQQPGAAAVSVSVDRLMVPGSLVSGSVVFSDGVKATWQVDQYGRLGLATAKAGYRPSQQDLASFQVELRRLLEGKGF